MRWLTLIVGPAIWNCQLVCSSSLDRTLTTNVLRSDSSILSQAIAKRPGTRVTYILKLLTPFNMFKVRAVFKGLAIPKMNSHINKRYRLCCASIAVVDGNGGLGGSLISAPVPLSLSLSCPSTNYYLENEVLLRRQRR